MIIYGRNSVIEAFRSDCEISKVIVNSSAKNDSRINEIISGAKRSNLKIEYKDSRELDIISGSVDNQGIAADIAIETTSLKQVLATGDGNFIYVLESSFVHNIGAIIRTAECLNYKGVIIPPNVKITASMVKTSAGSIFHIPIINDSIFNVIKTLNKSFYNIYGIERGGEEYSKVDLTGNSLFIIGGENKELSSEIQKKCDKVLTIPQFGHVNSLNMSVAASIVMYEQQRQNLNR